MINLLQVELKKIFKKKSIYIIWSIMLVFCLLNNFLYQKDYDEDGNYKYLFKEDLEKEETELKNELSKYDHNNSNEATMYITLKTKLEIIELKKHYSNNSWQYNKINDYLYDTLYQYNYYKYITPNNKQLASTKEKCIFILEKLNNDDYQYFLELEYQNNLNKLSKLQTEYNNISDKKKKKEIETQIQEFEFEQKILNYRIKYNIKEDSSYLNKSLENYQENTKTVMYFDNLKKEKNHQEKLAYQSAISEIKISQYIIEKGKNINKQNNLSYQLRTIVEDYEAFIVVLILIICSTIICDEFKDGTIKLLLIKPYSRCKILLSKVFTSIIVLLLSILMLIGMQLIVGGIIFGFDSLNIPVVVYNFTKNQLVEYSIFQYMLIRIIANLPFLLILITFTLFIGILTTSTITSITIPLIIYMFTPAITSLAIQYRLEFMKYLANLNWDIQNRLFGRVSEIPFINLKFSLILLTIYFIILGIITYTIFQKKDIKNI